MAAGRVLHVQARFVLFPFQQVTLGLRSVPPRVTSYHGPGDLDHKFVDGKGARDLWARSANPVWVLNLAAVPWPTGREHSRWQLPPEGPVDCGLPTGARVELHWAGPAGALPAALHSTPQAPPLNTVCGCWYRGSRATSQRHAAPLNELAAWESANLAGDPSGGPITPLVVQAAPAGKGLPLHPAAARHQPPSRPSPVPPAGHVVLERDAAAVRTRRPEHHGAQHE
ncbi:hypothetical protein ACCO45_006582 [Purpureocillium lilacinum]|uniref:Uncharacterized protein n=1 Tax=Purpureocillium lilacinum TaxID=33203 RepID=A0ACC4DPV8_PURLI